MNDDIYIIKMPDGFTTIIETLIERNWLISVHNVSDKERYNPANYLYNKNINNIEYKILLDSNIFSYILSAYKKDIKKKIHRDVIGLVVFCQYSEILFDMFLPLYEKTSCRKDKLKESLSELELFLRIDDSPKPQSLINFSNGLQDDFEINDKKVIDYQFEDINKWFEKYNKLKEWDSLYLIMLKITDILICKNKSDNEGFKILMIWLHCEFRYSLISIVYSMFLFGKNRLKGMMKYRRNDDKKRKKEQIENMTWDIFIINNYFRRMQEKKESEEYIVASNDNVLKTVLKAALEVQNLFDFNSLKKYLHESNYEMIDIIESIKNSEMKREFNGVGFNNENQRYTLIDEYEKKLF